MAKNTSYSSGIGCFTMIFLILLVLKLFDLIHISWWWVFSPLIVDVGLFVILGIIIFFIIRKK